MAAEKSKQQMNSPREMFQRMHQEEVRKLAIAINEPWFQKAVIYTRAQMSYNGVSADRPAGVNDFIETFSELAEEIKPPAIMPDKSELKSYK